MKASPVHLRARCLLIFVVLLFSSCSRATPTDPARTPGATSPPEATRRPPQATATAPAPPALSGLTIPIFALFQPPAVEVVPAVEHEPIAPDLGNVRVNLILTDAQIERLGRDGIVVGLGEDKEFFTLYEQARYNNEPIFVTSDSLLHVYHLLFDKVLRTAETESFIPLLRDLNAALLAETDRQYRALQGTPWEDAARRSVAFVGVASKLLDSDVRVPAYASDLVEAELTLVEDAAGIQRSPLFPGLEFGEDYTQYIARGHYTRSPELAAYFKSMMWYGRMTFRLKTLDPEAGRAETRSALLLVNALREARLPEGTALEAWEALYSPTVFFVGRSDDLTVTQYLEVMEHLYGARPALTDLIDEARLDEFIALADQLPPPRILGIVISDTADVEESTKGLRFMGQRFVPDAYVFRQLIYRNVGTRDDRRGLPKGLDLMAAMGSERAYEHLDAMGETQYENYEAQMEKARAWLASVTEAEWTETLNNAWLYSFYPLIEVPGPGYPDFMRSEAWLDKQLNTSLGSWAELKHDTILYAKQVYAEMGAGPPPPPPLPPRGYVEPVPEFYARLLALTTMTREGLESRGLLSELDRDSLTRLESLVGELLVMAEKELAGQPLTEEEYERIRFYGGELEHLTMAAADTELDDPFAPRYMDEEPQVAVIADVATDPDHRGDGVDGLAVLEEAVGRVNPIFVVVPIFESDGSSYLQVAKGGVFSYYEFVWPGNDRLTDEKWREMLETGQAPAPPGWTESFTVPEGTHSLLGSGLFSFQKALTEVYWNPANSAGYQYAALDPFRAELAQLAADRQYVGHQLVRSQVRSFDLQSPDLAVVTVREVWRDTLHEHSGEYPTYDEPASASRGPYTLDATYTLERGGDEFGELWQVTRLVYADSPPAWE